MAKKLLKKAIECGYSWRDTENNHYDYVVDNCPFLYFNNDFKMLGISTISIFTYKDEYEEVKAEYILSIEIEEKEEIKEIDLLEYAKRFKPFDKVICCDGDDEDPWRATFYSHFTLVNGNLGTYPFQTTGSYFSYCLPYKGNEDLVGQIFNEEDYKNRISQL